MDNVSNRLPVSRKQNKLPLFITVYEKLYDAIVSGEYRPGSQLPSETELAKQMKVSRGTLRQALLFLQEDRLIINRHGIGNFVAELSNDHLKGIEALSNLLINYCHYPIDKIEHKLLFQAANSVQKDQMELSDSSLVAFLENYYYVEGKIVALGMMFVPYQMLESNNVNLEKPELIYQFYLDCIEGTAVLSDTQLQVVNARKSTAEKMKIEEKDAILMVEETIYIEKEPSLMHKCYCRPDYFRFQLCRKNDRF